MFFSSIGKSNYYKQYTVISAADAKSAQTGVRCSLVEVIATQFLRSSSRSGWPLRNIHISNESVPFNVDFFISFLYHRQDFYLTIYVSNSMVSIKKQEMLTLCEHLGSPPVFGGVLVAHLFSFLCVVYFLRPVSCVPNVASVSGLSILDCSFGFI